MRYIGLTVYVFVRAERLYGGYHFNCKCVRYIVTLKVNNYVACHVLLSDHHLTLPSFSIVILDIQLTLARHHYYSQYAM